MRLIPTASLAAAVAFAMAAQAQVTTFGSARTTQQASTTTAITSTASTVQGTPQITQQGTFVTSKPHITSPANAAASATSSSTTTTVATDTTAPPNQTSVDLRDAQTRAATVGTHASGSTSALGPLASGAASANSATSTVGTGTTAGAGATGRGPSVNTVAPFAGMPILSNLSDATFGAPVVAANSVAPAISANGIGSSDVLAGSSVLQPDVLVTTETRANSVSVDRAINQVTRDRKRIGRDGQLLHSLAPRTNVDRTWQMPDDGPAPSLTGSNSTLTR